MESDQAVLHSKLYVMAWARQRPADDATGSKASLTLDKYKGGNVVTYTVKEAGKRVHDRSGCNQLFDKNKAARLTM